MRTFCHAQARFASNNRVVKYQVDLKLQHGSTATLLQRAESYVLWMPRNKPGSFTPQGKDYKGGYARPSQSTRCRCRTLPAQTPPACVQLTHLRHPISVSVSRVSPQRRMSWLSSQSFLNTLLEAQRQPHLFGTRRAWARVGADRRREPPFRKLDVLATVRAMVPKTQGSSAIRELSPSTRVGLGSPSSSRVPKQNL